jgi:WD40 repeat protein/class 3 adenylate cyclase/GTPase SAR1 family protein
MNRGWKARIHNLVHPFKKKKDTLTGERATGVILLVDIVNYSAQAGRAGDEKSELFLKSFVKEVKEIVMRYEGTFIKSDGDAVIIFINDILKFLELVQELRRRSKKNDFNYYGIRGEIRIVAHYGRFRLDLSKEGQYDIIGAEVIKVFRIEKIAGKHQVVITAILFDMVKHDLKDCHVRWEPLGPMKFKGFDEPISLYRLVFPDEVKAKPRHVLGWETAMENLENQTKQIPVFGDFYPPIDMEKNFINLDIVREGEVNVDGAPIPKMGSPWNREHRGAYERRDDEDKEEKRETILEQERKQRYTNAADLYENYRQGVILGMPGSGKTTILSYFAYRELEKNRQLKEKKKQRVVLFIQCRDVLDFNHWYHLTRCQEWPGEIDPEANDILKYFTFHFVSNVKSSQSLTVEEIEELEKTEKYVLEAYNNGNLTLLIDALDECKTIEIKKSILDFVKVLFKPLSSLDHGENIQEESRVFLSARYFEKQELFTGKEASVFQPVFEVHDLNREQLRDLARYFYQTDPQLLKEFDAVVWQDENVIKVASTPLTALLVLAYFENFKQLETRYSLYNILVTFILIRAWDQIKSKNFRKKFKEMKTFFKKAREKNIFQDHEYKEAGEVYDILSFLAFDFLAGEAKNKVKDKEKRINEQAILGLFEKCKKDGTIWLKRFVEDHLLARTGNDQYVFIHFTVMEYLAARFMVEKYKNSDFLEDINYGIDLNNVERGFFQSEILPIAVGSEVITGIGIFKLLKEHTHKIENKEDQKLYYKTVFKALAEFESFTRRWKETVQINYLQKDIEKILRENADAIEWIYKYIRRLLLTKDKEELKAALKEYNGVAKLSQPHLLKSYLAYEEFSEEDSETELYRTRLLEQLIETRHLDEWLDKSETRRIDPLVLEQIQHLAALDPDSLLVFDTGEFSPEDKNFKYYARSTGTQLKGFLGSPNLKHSKSVNCIRVCDNTVISGSDDGTIKYWDIRSGKETLCLEAHSHGVIDIGITEKMIISAGSNGEIKLWDKETAEKIRDLGTPVEKLNVMAVDSQTIVLGTGDGTINIIDMEKQKEGKILNAHQYEIESIALAGKTIISGGADGSIYAWDLETRGKTWTFEGHADAVRDIVVTGETFISGAADGTLTLWDIKTGQAIKNFERHTERIETIAVSGKKIAAGAVDGFIKIWDLDTGKILRSIRAHIFGVNSVAIKDDIIISAAGDASIKLWHMENGKEAMGFKRHHGERVNSVAIMGDNIVTGSDDNTIKTWNTVTRKATVMKGHTMNVGCVLATRGFIISGSASGDIKIWDMESKREIRTLKGHKKRVNCLGLNDNQIISGASDKTIKLWDINSGKEIHTFTGHKGRVNCLEAVNGFIVSGSSTGEIKIWNIESRVEADSFAAHQTAVSDLVVRRKQFISASYDHTIKLWNQDTQRCIRVFEGHTQPVNCVEIIGEYTLLSGASDGTLKLWNIHSGQCIKTIKLGWIPMDIACEAGNPNYIVTANANGTLTFFDLSDILNPGARTGENR